MLTALPFDGFYDTTHEAMVRDAVYFNPDTNHYYDEMSEEEYEAFDKALPEGTFGKAMTEYSRMYADRLAKELGIKMTFKDMESPKYYNYSTDRIFCEIDEEEVEKLKKRVDSDKMKEKVKKEFSSCSGFSSSYPNDYDEWLRQEEPFDHNQIETLIDCIGETETKDWHGFQVYACEGFSY